jgi:hypothetical protein
MPQRAGDRVSRLPSADDEEGLRSESMVELPGTARIGLHQSNGGLAVGDRARMLGTRGTAIHDGN